MSKAEKAPIVPKSVEHATEMGLKDRMSVNADTGLIEVEDDFYEESLPEGIDIGTVKKIQRHNAHLLPAVTAAAGDLAHDHFKEHGQGELKLAYKAGHDRHSVIFSHGGEEGSQVRASIQTHGVGDRGHLRATQEYVKGLLDGIST